MRDFNHKKTKTKCGKELSQLFIGEDGLLSAFVKDDECEIVGFHSNIFGDSFLVKEK